MFPNVSRSDKSKGNKKEQENSVLPRSEVMRTGAEVRLQTYICQHPFLMQLSVEANRNEGLLPNYTQSSPLCVELSQTTPGCMNHFLLAAPGPWTVTPARTMSAVSDRKRVFVNMDLTQRPPLTQSHSDCWDVEKFILFQQNGEFSKNLMWKWVKESKACMIKINTKICSNCFYKQYIFFDLCTGVRFVYSVVCD